MCLQDWFREKMDEGKFTYNKFVGFCCFHYLLLSTNHPCFLCAESGIMWVTVGSAGRPAGRRVGLRAGSGQHFRIFAGPRAGSGHEFFYWVFSGPTRPEKCPGILPTLSFSRQETPANLGTPQKELSADADRSSRPCFSTGSFINLTELDREAV